MYADNRKCLNYFILLFFFFLWESGKYHICLFKVVKISKEARKRKELPKQFDYHWENSSFLFLFLFFWSLELRIELRFTINNCKTLNYSSNTQNESMNLVTEDRSNAVKNSLFFFFVYWAPEQYNIHEGQELLSISKTTTPNRSSHLSKQNVSPKFMGNYETSDNETVKTARLWSSRQWQHSDFILPAAKSNATLDKAFEQLFLNSCQM